MLWVIWVPPIGDENALFLRRYRRSCYLLDEAQKYRYDNGSFERLAKDDEEYRHREQASRHDHQKLGIERLKGTEGRMKGKTVRPRVRVLYQISATRSVCLSTSSDTGIASIFIHEYIFGSTVAVHLLE